MSAEIELRAAGLLTMLHVVEERLGAAACARAVDAIEPEGVRESVRAKRLLPSTWLPLTPYRTLLRGLAVSEDELRLLSRASATHDVTTMYKLVFKLMSPETLARQTPRLFGIYYRGANIRVIESDKRSARIEYRDCHGFDRLVWLDYMAGAEVVLELCGAKNVRTVVESGGTADTLLASAVWDL